MINPQFSNILALYIVLALFGYGFGWLYQRAEKKGYTEGLDWLAVGVWLGVSVGMTALVSWQFALLVLGACLCSGAPVAGRRIWQYVRRRQFEQERARTDTYYHYTEIKGSSSGDGEDVR